VCLRNKLSIWDLSKLSENWKSEREIEFFVRNVRISNIIVHADEDRIYGNFFLFLGVTLDKWFVIVLKSFVAPIREVNFFLTNSHIFEKSLIYLRYREVQFTVTQLTYFLILECMQYILIV
jgi:hypothetical protein